MEEARSMAVVNTSCVPPQRWVGRNRVCCVTVVHGACCALADAQRSGVKGVGSSCVAWPAFRHTSRFPKKTTAALCRHSSSGSDRPSTWLSS